MLVEFFLILLATNLAFYWLLISLKLRILCSASVITWRRTHPISLRAVLLRALDAKISLAISLHTICFPGWGEFSTSCGSMIFRYVPFLSKGLGKNNANLGPNDWELRAQRTVSHATWPSGTIIGPADSNDLRWPLRRLWMTADSKTLLVAFFANFLITLSTFFMQRKRKSRFYLFCLVAGTWKQNFFRLTRNAKACCFILLSPACSITSGKDTDVTCTTAIFCSLCFTWSCSMSTCFSFLLSISWIGLKYSTSVNIFFKTETEQASRSLTS